MRSSILVLASTGILSAAQLPAQKAAEGNSASVDEIAQQLANPNTPLASLNFKLQYREFAGDLPGADSQSGTTLLFQPTLPFALENGDQVFWRPALPVQMGMPGIDPNTGQFESETGLGDLAFDIAYGGTTAGGLLWAGGGIFSLPTATDDLLGTDRITAGPEFLIAQMTEKRILGIFPNHQWDVGGSGDKDISLTTIQGFIVFLPGGGWNMGTTPIMTYDHLTDDWTIPLNFTLGKTVIRGGRPWKIGLELNYYVEKPDAFGPDWFIGFNIAPVVENALANWFD